MFPEEWFWSYASQIEKKKKQDKKNNNKTHTHKKKKKNFFMILKVWKFVISVFRASKLPIQLYSNKFFWNKESAIYLARFSRN